MGDVSDVKMKWAGGVALDEGGADTIDNITDLHVQYAKTAADGMASTTTANTVIGFINPYPFSLTVVSGRILPTSTLTASDTDYATITIKTDDGAAGTPAVALTWDTKTTASSGTGSWSTSVKVDNSSRTAANCTLVTGGVLWINIAKAGSGVVVPISHVMVKLRRI